MRRGGLLGSKLGVALGLALCLTGCGTGYDDFIGDIATVRRNVNQPQGDSETMRRIRAQSVDLPPLVTEAGNVWPAPVRAEPTLQDLERGPNGVTPAAQQPVPGSPGFRGRGSSTPPGNTQPPLPANSVPTANAPPNYVPAAAPPTGRVVQTPRGPAVQTGGTSTYNTVISPGGRTAITIPNGNGTSTLINPDGTVQTIPTTK